MGHQLGLYGQAGLFSLSDRFDEMSGIPVNDDGGEQVEPGYAVVLALARAVADFALSPDPERVLEGVMSLALVQTGVGPALHVGVEQPVDDEERAFDPSDFPESDGQFVLARLARVAATRRMLAQFRTITSSRILLSVNPIRGCGTRPGSKTCSRFDGRSRMRRDVTGFVA